MGVPSTKRFTIRRRLGEGGMGVVYEAFDEERRASVALKTLNRFDAAALARFKREFRALQGLAHPNLVALDELLFENDQWFFTMELLDGVDFVSYVRGSGPKVAYQSTVRESIGKLAARPAANGIEVDGTGAGFDEAKLRDALRQLLEGLAALHAVDRVHRDIKPSNVLVTGDGRVVVLDFGLVTEASAEDRSNGSAVVGTPAYMAPEQAASREVGPPADLYAVGAMLYEAMTGHIPIEGPQLQILIDKQSKEPARPSSLAAGVPRDLDTLCMRLLGFDPSSRPPATDILRLLALPMPQGSTPDLRRSITEAPTFIGRTAELAELRAAYDVSRSERLSTVLVCGESGIGKSYLVRRFTAQLLGEVPEAMLLEGRCYERENVPYKTLDGVVDALSAKLARLPSHEAAALLPARSGILAQVFPALLRVPQAAREHAATALTVDPNEYRQRAFVALRDLFTRIALRRPTITVIDDMQWADDDGLRALAEILRPPDAPPLLLIGTVRVAPGKNDAGLARLRAMMPGETRVIELARMDQGEARELAAALLRRTDNADADAETIASEAGGHPLFVEELTRHVALGGTARQDVKLDDAIWSRIVQLEPPTRELAELVAIAGKPIAQEVVAAAARIEPGEFNRRAATLRASYVVRTGGARWADAIEPYHDRVREAVLARLDVAQRRSLHERLAIAVESSAHPDPEPLAAYWREAGNVARATTYAVKAGDQAARTFAFDRAAQWYEEALGMLPEESEERREIHAKLGDALANAGRGGFAAPHFEAAAARSAPMEALELRRRAADQLVRSGHLDRGLAVARQVLAAIGIRMPTTRTGAIAALLYYRFLLLVRGHRFRERERAQVTAQDRTHLDACLSLGTALGAIDPIVGFVLITRGLLRALATGDLEHVVRAVSAEAVTLAATGGREWQRVERRFEHARVLAEKSGTIVARVYAVGLAGCGFYLNGHFREAAERLSQVLEMLQDGSPGLAFEKVTLRIFLIRNLTLRGRFKEQQRHQREGLRDAQRRGDLYAAVNMRVGFMNLAYLAADRPDLAESHLRAATTEWTERGYNVLHYEGAVSLVNVALYRGDVETAHARAMEHDGRTRHSLLWRVQLIRALVLQLGATCALAMLERGAGEKKQLLRTVETAAGALERESLAWVRPFVTVARAGIALHRGARDEAVAGIDTAASEFTSHDMLGYAAAARYHAAVGRADAAEKKRTLDYFRAEDVVAPERMIRTLLAGFPE